MTHYLKIFQRWTVSAFQQHPSCLFVCDEDATLELRVKTVKYFKVIDRFIYLNFIINGDGSALCLNYSVPDLFQVKIGRK